MKLKAFVTSLDEVDEKYHELYVADGEGFKLDVEAVGTHPEVTALSSALARQKQRVRELSTENGTLKNQVAELPEDFDRDLYDRAVANGVAGPGGKLPNEDEVRREAAEAATTKANAKHKTEIDKLTGERDRLKARVETGVRNAALDEALDQVKVIDPAYRRAARALLAPSISVIEHDGEYEPIAKDPELGDIPVAEHVKTWASSDEGKAFVGARDSAGGGANGGGSGNNVPSSDSTNNPFKPGKTFNATDQARLRRENPALAAKLMREAGIKVPA